MTESSTTKKPRQLEEARVYALSHRIRTEILAMLHERPRSPSELSKSMALPLSTVSHHIEELVRDTSIELAKIERVRNTNEHFYRAVKLPFYTDEEMWSMSPEERQEIYGLILQSSTAEALAAFWAGKMTMDPRIWMAWCWFNVDAQGREDIADEQARSWARIQEIEGEAANRLVESDEDPVSIVVTSHGFMRNRTSLTPPWTLLQDDSY